MRIKYIDLFCGIGGFRIALDSLGWDCVFSADIDEHACQTYELNFGENPKCDISKLDVNTLPDFDVLCAGFPCQSFSISGYKKGFLDETRGTLFFDIVRILDAKKPEYFILENVKNLEKHDKGRTFSIMLNALHALGYAVSYSVLNARDFGVPQNRERVVIVGNRRNKYFDFSTFNINRINSMENFLDKEGDFHYLNKKEYTLLPEEIRRVQNSGLIFAGYRNKPIRTNGVREGTMHLSRVHKQFNRIYSYEGTHPTIPSQEPSGRFWILTKEEMVRSLTLSECFRFMGFPEDYKKVGTDGKNIERIGNSICVNMVKEVGIQIQNQLMKTEDNLMQTASDLLEEIYNYCFTDEMYEDKFLNEEQLNLAKTIVDKEKTLKGVYTALVSSLTYKTLHPEQDVRLHKIEFEGGYSGRSYDTRYVTPFLKTKNFDGKMKESGWLTRSIEQASPFNLDFPGKISNSNVKRAFLEILNDVEVNNANPREYLTTIFFLSIEKKKKNSVEIISPITKENTLRIDEIVSILEEHFSYGYSSRGASILPVLAIYSIYELLIDELERFSNMELDLLNSHYSSDKSSGAAGDIDIRSSINKELYEVVEVKYNITIDEMIVRDVYEKIKKTRIQRYYILSTYQPENKEKIADIIETCEKEHGCQIIVNGIYPTIKYYLRLLKNTDDFIERYILNLKNNDEIPVEKKIAFNTVVDKFLSNK